MRTEKFDNSKSGYETDDIKYAFDYNGLSAYLENIDVIVAEVCGENDGCDWHWLLKMKDKTYRYASGGCDYTGWDCQSSAQISEPVKTVKEAIALAPEKDSYDRFIRACLKDQIRGKTPFAVYSFSYPTTTYLPRE